MSSNEQKATNESRDDRGFEHQLFRAPGHMPADPAKIRDFGNNEMLKDSVDVTQRINNQNNNPYSAQNSQMNARKMRQMN